MDAKAKAELDDIKRELNSIINELENISAGIRNDFIGIGNDKCANALDKVLNQYYIVRRKLNNLDTTTVSENFTRTHGGGGMVNV